MSIQIRWLAHAAFQIKANGKTIYLDPRYMKSLESKIGSFFENPDKADTTLFTHHHADHCYPSSFKKMLTSDTKIIAPELCEKKLDNDSIRIKLEMGSELMTSRLELWMYITLKDIELLEDYGTSKEKG